MRVLIITAMYPTESEPVRGSFVRRQLEAMHALDPSFSWRVVCPAVGPLGFPWNALRFAAMAGGGLSAALRGGYDIVHAHGYAPAGIIACRVAALRGKPFIITAHGSDVEAAAASPVLGRLARRAAGRAAALISVSQHLRTRLREVSGFDSEVVYVGLEPASLQGPDRPAARRELGLEPGAELVLFVGNLVPEKGADLLLKAMPGVLAGRPAASLVLVGEGRQRADLEKEAAGLPGGAVRFLGNLERPLLNRWMAAADMLVMPSRREALGLAGLEAMAHGTPVIASSRGGASDYIADGRDGRLVDPEDASALAAAILRWLEHPEEREAAAVLARERAAAFESGIGARRMLEIYRRVTA